MSDKSLETQEEQPKRYPNLHAVPTKRLATNIVGSLIMAKGLINRWQSAIEHFLTIYREEEEEREEILRKLREEIKAVEERERGHGVQHPSIFTERLRLILEGHDA